MSEADKLRIELESLKAYYKGFFEGLLIDELSQEMRKMFELEIQKLKK